MREVTNSNNIGSIITMLIDEQHVNIEDILTEEQYRQDCQHQNQVTSGPRKVNIFSFFVTNRQRSRRRSSRHWRTSVATPTRTSTSASSRDSRTTCGPAPCQTSTPTSREGWRRKEKLEILFSLITFCSESANSAFSNTDRGREG